MEQKLLDQFAGFMEKQEILSRMTEGEGLHGYSYSEVHTLVAVEELAEPNLAEIARRMNLSRGAVSKLAKRLEEKGLLESYRREDNRQKVFLRLTERGKQLFGEHEKRHKAWLERDRAFLSCFAKREVEFVARFMGEYNEYLNGKIKELERKKR